MPQLAYALFMIAGILIVVRLTILLVDRLQSDPEGEEIPAPAPWIVEKVNKARKNASNYLECLRTGICPLCGAELREKVYGAYDQFSDHECKKCGFASLCEVLY